jgi:predicted DNA-binding transcriptional regulator AlpA
MSERSITLSAVAEEELAGLAEVAETLGVSKVTAMKYARRDDFPEPLGRLASGPIWRRRDVESWGRENLPLRRGRPPQTRP